MRLDDVHSALISDPIIIQFGRVLIKQLGPRRSNYVSQRMRQIARLKIQLNTLVNGKKNLEYYISPKYFDLKVKAIHELAGFHVNEQTISVFTTPSLALNIGHSLVKVAEMRRGNAVRQIDDLMKRECDEFLEMHCSDIYINVKIL